jgi:hypothetical protein
MQDKSKPYMIQFPKIGESMLGYISLTEKANLPFVPKRIYWTYYTPEAVVRGNHSHYELEQILVAVAGRVDVKLIISTGEEFEFCLDSPDKGLFIPKMCWRTMKYTHNSVQMCIASHEYDEKDYIRDFNKFKETYLK